MMKFDTNEFLWMRIEYKGGSRPGEKEKGGGGREGKRGRKREGRGVLIWSLCAG